SAMVGSNSAGGGISSGLTSSWSDGTSPASRRMSPNSALVVSNPSSMLAPLVVSSPSTRLVVSISSEVSGSAVTGSTRLSPIGAGSAGGSGDGGGGCGTGGGAGFGAGTTRPPGRSLVARSEEHTSELQSRGH